MPEHEECDEEEENESDEEKESEIMNKLIHGYKLFRRHSHQALSQKLKKLSTEGQNCKVLCISCCDSRYDPQLVFNAEPGEIFTVRNVANVVPKFDENTEERKLGHHHGTCAAIEYAVKGLGVEAIVVLGHAQCGGCAHALKLFGSSSGSGSDAATLEARREPNEDGSGYVDAWCGLIKESVESVCENYDVDERLRQLEHENVRKSVENVQSFPFVRERIKNGSLQVFGGFFTIFSGGLCLMDPDTKKFERVNSDIEDSSE